MSPTPEQIKSIEKFISQLSENERNDLLNRVHSSGIKGMQQFNSDKAKSVQVEVNGGTAYTGNIKINNNIIDAKCLEKLIRKIIAKESPSRGYLSEKEVGFFERTADKLELAIRNYDRYRYLLSNIRYVRFLVVVPVLIVLGIFFSGILNKTAVVVSPHLKGVNVKNDSGSIIEIIPNGTKVRLTGERDSENYCKTNRGWIYCDFLTENGSENPAVSQQAISDKSNASPKSAIVQPDPPLNSANLRTQPNAGKVIRTIAKGTQVQIIQCRGDACEISSGSNKGWIYKPYLRQQ